MTLPTRDEAAAAARTPFWITLIALWLLMLIVGVTLALALGIWHIWLAF